MFGRKKVKMTEKDLRWNRFVEEICNKRIDTLSEIQKKAVLCFWYDAEVNSGGHRGYFECYPETNSQELIEAIIAVSYKAIADNFQKALSDKSDENLEAADTAFYNFSPELCDCLMKYVEQNKDEIFN